MAEQGQGHDIDEATGGWEARRPAGEEPRYLVGHCRERREIVAGLRELADFLESRPDIPVGGNAARYAIYVDGTGAEKRAQIDHAASLLGTQVTDDTPSGGHYYAVRSFGPVTYEMAAVYPQADKPVFALGSPVRLDSDSARALTAMGFPRCGYVVGYEQQPNGEYLYTVHFPGHGAKPGWPLRALFATQFPPIGLVNGSVSSVEAAETILIHRAAEIRVGTLRGKSAGDSAIADHAALSEALSGFCGLPVADLLKQLEPQVRHYMRTHMGVVQPSTGAKGAAAAVASNPAAPEGGTRRKPPGGRSAVRA